jgi:predicted cupin superfamily sugar epimerase
MNLSSLSDRELIDHLDLNPHPEGGFFRAVYRSTETLHQTSLPKRYAGDRSMSTAIYFLLRAGEFSAFHRTASDEVWPHYLGDALELLMLSPSGVLSTTVVGNNLKGGETLTAVPPAGHWFASRPAPGSSYCLVGCTVAPGFDFADFEMADQAALIRDYPQHESVIRALTRLGPT